MHKFHRRNINETPPQLIKAALLTSRSLFIEGRAIKKRKRYNATRMEKRCRLKIFQSPSLKNSRDGTGFCWFLHSFIKIFAFLHATIRNQSSEICGIVQRGIGEEAGTVEHNFGKPRVNIF